jgi:hypothetical protein
MITPSPEATRAAEALCVSGWFNESEVARLIDEAFAALRERVEQRTVCLVYFDGAPLAAITFWRPEHPGSLLDWYAEQYAFERHRLTLGSPIDVVSFERAALSPSKEPTT